MRKKLLALPLLLTISGCSVVLAASGSKEPDFSKLQVGARRAVVEQELGPARDTTELPNGERVTYRYKLGDESAPGRALGYLVLDIFTFALAEYVLFPLEISNSGNAYQATVEYDKQNIVTKLSEKEEISSSPDT